MLKKHSNGLINQSEVIAWSGQNSEIDIFVTFGQDMKELFNLDLDIPDLDILKILDPIDFWHCTKTTMPVTMFESYNMIWCGM